MYALFQLLRWARCSVTSGLSLQLLPLIGLTRRPPNQCKSGEKSRNTKLHTVMRPFCSRTFCWCRTRTARLVSVIKTLFFFYKLQ
ncbi:hypothetical protein F5141DRAFT_1155888 [Pisolithus sp. B1]|nr:hypothetical protein F5141DRAFT_1155888 [Pisolithus sp. B1]